MLASVGLQVAAVLLFGLVAAGVSDWTSAWFFVLGGVAAIIPNALFALRLAMQRGRSPESFPVVFFLGEALKIGLTLGLLAWIVKANPDVRWLPMILGLMVALKAPLFALLVTGDRRAVQPASRQVEGAAPQQRGQGQV